MTSPSPHVHRPTAGPGQHLLTRCRNSVLSFFLFRHRAAATLFFSRRLFRLSSSSSSCEGRKPLISTEAGLEYGFPPDTQTDRWTTPVLSHISAERAGPACQPAGLEAGEMDMLPSQPMDPLRAGGYPSGSQGPRRAGLPGFCQSSGGQAWRNYSHRGGTQQVVTVFSPAQPKPSGHCFPNQWFPSTSIKTILGMGTAFAFCPHSFSPP